LEIYTDIQKNHLGHIIVGEEIIHDPEL